MGGEKVKKKSLGIHSLARKTSQDLLKLNVSYLDN